MAKVHWDFFRFIVNFIHTITNDIHKFWYGPDPTEALEPVHTTPVTPDNWVQINVDEDPQGWGFDVELDLNGVLEVSMDENVTTGY